jgi:hypothetical protein
MNNFFNYFLDTIGVQQMRSQIYSPWIDPSQRCVGHYNTCRYGKKSSINHPIMDQSTDLKKLLLHFRWKIKPNQRTWNWTVFNFILKRHR